METTEEKLRAAIKRILQAQVYHNGRVAEGISLELVGAMYDAGAAAGLYPSARGCGLPEDPHDDHLVSLMDWERG